MNDGGPSFLARLEPRHVIAIAALAAIGAFLPSLADGFVSDDGQLIVHNPYAHDLRHLGRCFTTDLWDTPDRPDATGYPKFYRPLVCASYALGWRLTSAPWAFHATNIALHAAAAALAARLALRWTGSPFGALVAALLFAVHPSRSENVIWVSGRTDLMMTVFLLAAHELCVSAARRPGLVRASLVPAAFLAALLSKEFAVCWPLLLSVEVVRSKASGDEGERRRLSIATVLALLGSAAYLVIRSRTLPIRPTELDALTMPVLLRAGYVLLSLGYYVERLLVPWPQTLQFRPVVVVNGAPVLLLPSVVAGAVAAALFSLWAFRARRKDRTLVAILGVTAALALPILNVSYTGFPGTTADRFLYLPLLPLGVALGRGARGALTRWSARRLSMLVVVSITLGYSAVSWVRSLDFTSDEALWRHEVEVNPDNPQALGALAQALASEGETEEAFALLQRAISPGAARFHLLANATRCYLVLLEIQGPRIADGNVAALRSLLDELGSLVSRGVPAGPPDRTAADLTLAAPSDAHFSAQVANGVDHLAAAAALVASRLGRGDVVREMASRLGPEAPIGAPGRYNLALALGRIGDYAAAGRELSRATDLDSTPAVQTAAGELARTLEQVAELRRSARDLPPIEARLARAQAFTALGAYLGAARELRAAFAAAPDDPRVQAAYFEALVSARLEQDAAGVATRAFGPGAASERLDAARSRLSRRTARAVAPAAGSAWWQ